MYTKNLLHILILTVSSIAYAADQKAHTVTVVDFVTGQAINVEATQVAQLKEAYTKTFNTNETILCAEWSPNAFKSEKLGNYSAV